MGSLQEMHKLRLKDIVLDDPDESLLFLHDFLLLRFIDKLTEDFLNDFTLINLVDPLLELYFHG